MKKEKKATTKNLDISGRKGVDETSRRLATVMRDSNDAIIIQDIDGRITTWNRGAELMYGYSEAEALGMNIEHLSPPDRVAEQEEFTRRLILGEAVTSFETQRVTKDGRILDVWLTVTKLVEDPADIVISTGRDIRRPIGIALIERNITERKRTEEALIISEVRYRRLFESAKDGILILDAETGMVVDINPFLIKMLRYSHEQFIGKTIWESWPLKGILPNREKFLELQRHEYICYEDLHLETADGRHVSVEFVSNVYLVGQKRLIQCNIRDITERKWAEKALQESEKKYRTLFEDSIDAVLISTFEGMILDCNDAMLNLTGYKKEELIGLNARKLYVNPADREMIVREIQETGSVKEYTVKWIKKDGTEIDILMTLTAWRDEDGNILGFQGIVRDVTERKRFEVTLKESEQKFRELADLLPQTVCEIDLKGRFTYVNKYGLKIHGYTWDELEKRLDALDLFIPAQRDRFAQNISRVLSGQKFDDHEYSVLRKDGSTYPALVYTNIIVRKDQAVGVRALVVDITERKKVEQMKTDFVSFISHQLRTPVSGLMAYIDNMLDGVTGALSDMQADYLREMRGVCARSNRLIANLLSISRLERGVVPVTIKLVKLKNIVDATIQDYITDMKEKRLSLNIREVDRDISVQADSDKLIEVLKNVIHNAIKFTMKDR